MVLGVGIAAAVGYLGVTVEEDSVSVGVGVPSTMEMLPPPPPPPDAPVAPSTSVATEVVDLVHVSATPAFEVLEAEAGPGVRASRLVIYPEYVVATVEASDEPGGLDRWVIHPGSDPIGPDPQRNVGDVEAELFSVGELDPALLTSLPERALAELEIAGATVGYLIVDRATAEPREVEIRVYANSERHSGYVRFGPDGTVRSVHS